MEHKHEHEFPQIDEGKKVGHDHEIKFPQVEKLKQHFQENWKMYGGAVVGVGIGFMIKKRPIEIAPIFNNTVAPVITNTINNGGYARKIIRCLETDQMWPSMKEAAEATGNHLTMMSKHCNGHLDDLHGLHYVIDGLATG
jgi:hypothetical protein